MKQSARLAAGLFVATLAACGSERAPAQKEAVRPQGTSGGAASADAGVAVHDAAPPAQAYPSVGLQARPGETVLVLHQGTERSRPRTLAEREARPFARVVEGERIVLAPAKVVSVGASSSAVAGADGLAREAPNAALIPWPSKATAKPGDIVLAFDDGSPHGVALARITEGGSPSAPAAVPLLDQLHFVGGDIDPIKLAPGSFLPLAGELSPGTSVAVRRPDGTRVPRLVLRVDGDLLLTLERGTVVAIPDRAHALPVPVREDASVGQRILAPVGKDDAFVEAEVIHLWRGDVISAQPTVVDSQGRRPHAMSVALSQFFVSRPPGWRL